MYLKFFLPCLLLIAACKQQDQQLITKIETEIQTRQSELDKYQTIGANLEKFKQELDAALPNQAGAPADSLKIKANTIVNREKAAIDAYKENITGLTNRLAEYRLGTATKEDLELEYKTVQASLGQMGATFATLEEEYKQCQEALSARQKQPQTQ